MSEARFRIGSEIVHEAVDGEVIAIDLVSGSYYSLAGSGPAIWEQLGDGASEAEIRVAILSRFDGDAAEIGDDVAAFLGQLRDNGLIVGEAGGANGATPRDDASGTAPYEAPRFERYTDMKDYFLLDPIHEVDTAGWPRPAA